ncbi:hypothetical protein [Nonomuraea sp. NPDC005650]
MIAPGRLSFMVGAGLPLSTELRKTFVEVDEPEVSAVVVAGNDRWPG